MSYDDTLQQIKFKNKKLRNQLKNLLFEDDDFVEPRILEETSTHNMTKNIDIGNLINKAAEDNSYFANEASHEFQNKYNDTKENENLNATGLRNKSRKELTQTEVPSRGQEMLDNFKKEIEEVRKRDNSSLTVQSDSKARSKLLELKSEEYNHKLEMKKKETILLDKVRQQTGIIDDQKESIASLKESNRSLSAYNQEYIVKIQQLEHENAIMKDKRVAMKNDYVLHHKERIFELEKRNVDLISLYEESEDKRIEVEQQNKKLYQAIQHISSKLLIYKNDTDKNKQKIQDLIHINRFLTKEIICKDKSFQDNTDYLLESTTVRLLKNEKPESNIFTNFTDFSKLNSLAKFRVIIYMVMFANRLRTKLHSHKIVGEHSSKIVNST